MKPTLSLLALLFTLSLTSKSLFSANSFEHDSHNAKIPRSSGGHSSIFILNNRGRLLATSSVDTYDDMILYKDIENTTNGSFEEESRMTEINSQVLSFQSGFDELRQKLETFRRYSPAVIADDIRVSALNAYIENAIIMQSLGVLDEDDEEVQNEVYDDYYASALNGRKRKARKVARAGFGKVNAKKNWVHRKLKRGYNKVKRGLKNKIRRNLSNNKRKLSINAISERPVGIGEKLDRANSLEFGEFNVQQSESSGPFVDRFDRERRLNNLNSSISSSGHLDHGVVHSSGTTNRMSLSQPSVNRKPVKALHHRRPERLTAIQKIRQGDELLELARQGTLFNFDVNSIYSIPEGGIPNFWHPASKRKVKI